MLNTLVMKRYSMKRKSAPLPSWTPPPKKKKIGFPLDPVGGNSPALGCLKKNSARNPQSWLPKSDYMLLQNWPYLG